MQPKYVAKFEIQDLLPIALTIVVTGIAVVYGISVVDDVRDEQATCTAGQTYNESGGNCYNATANSYGPTGDAFVAANDTLTGLAKLPEKLPTIVTVIVAAVIIGILVRYLMVNV